VRAGRRGVGIELKPGYYAQAIANLESVAVVEQEQTDLGFESAVTPSGPGGTE
jgi:hypothetical protein